MQTSSMHLDERRLESLTGREREVLVNLTNGDTNNDIGRRLGISARTVQKHLQQIYAKLGVERRAAAAVVAVRFVQPTE